MPGGGRRRCTLQVGRGPLMTYGYGLPALIAAAVTAGVGVMALRRCDGEVYCREPRWRHSGSGLGSGVERGRERGAPRDSESAETV